jgi:hypothetical protein
MKNTQPLDSRQLAFVLHNQLLTWTLYRYKLSQFCIHGLASAIWNSNLISNIQYSKPSTQTNDLCMHQVVLTHIIIIRMFAHDTCLDVKQTSSKARSNYVILDTCTH